MYKNYGSEDLWRLLRGVYVGAVRPTWDPENGWYRDVCENGKGSSYISCHVMAYHLLHYVREHNPEDVWRAARIVEHIVENRDIHTGFLRSIFGEKGTPPETRWYPRLVEDLAVAVKYWNVLNLGDDLRSKFLDEFYHYIELDKAAIEHDPHNNQNYASYFVSLAYAYWATGDPVLLTRAKEIAKRMPYIYTEDHPLAPRAGYAGCHLDWTWNYAQRKVFESEGATHSVVYQNGHVGFWLQGHRLFKLAGVHQFPWLPFLRKMTSVCLLGNISSDGREAYMISPYMPADRYSPYCSFNIAGTFAAWAAISPETLINPKWAGLARFLWDRAIQTIKNSMDPKGTLPRDYYNLAEYTWHRGRWTYVGNNYAFLNIAAHVASFADIDSVKPQVQRYWDWRWFWDIVHVRGETYDAHLAGWTNRKTTDPYYVGGSISRLFTASGKLVFPFCVNRFSWMVETEDGAILDSAEACRGRKAEGYDFWVEHDGERLERPRDYETPNWPIGFNKVKSHWRVLWDKVGEMIIENTFHPDKIQVENTFIPCEGVHVKRVVQSFPFTRYWTVSWRENGESSESEYPIDWLKMFEASKKTMELSKLKYAGLMSLDRKARVFITPEEGVKGAFTINDGELTVKWPDGWNYISLSLSPDERKNQTVSQRYTLSITEKNKEKD